MKIRLLAEVAVLIILAASPTQADDDYVSYAKSLPAKKFDKNLPSIPTEQWLASSLPSGIVAVWGNNVTACGEQTGDPEIDKKRDMPLCVEIELKKKDKSVGYLLLLVGTEKKGKEVEAVGLYYGYIKQGDKTLDLNTLQEVIKLKQVLYHINRGDRE
jgi:hypothetical protein